MRIRKSDKRIIWDYDLDNINLKKEVEYYKMTEVGKREKDRQFGKFIKKAKEEQKALAFIIQSRMLALLCSGSWFEGVSTREDVKFEVDGLTFEVRLENYEVKTGNFPLTAEGQTEEDEAAA